MIVTPSRRIIEPHHRIAVPCPKCGRWRVPRPRRKPLPRHPLRRLPPMRRRRDWQRWRAPTVNMPLYTLDGKLLIVDGMLASDEACCTCECDNTACLPPGCTAPPFGCCCDPCLIFGDEYADTPPTISCEVTGISPLPDDVCCSYGPAFGEEQTWVKGIDGIVESFDISATLTSGAQPDDYAGNPCVYYGTASGTGIEFEFFSDDGCTVPVGGASGDFQITWIAGDPGNLFITFDAGTYFTFCTTPPDFNLGCPHLPQTIGNFASELCTLLGSCGATSSPLFTGGSAVIDIEC